MKMSETQIITKDLNVWIGKKHILKNINIEIPKKQITAIIGPSGCGKTTLLKCFNRLIDLTDNVKIKGKVIVDGENIFDPDIKVIDLPRIREKMGLLSQKPYPLPMSIYDNVAYGPRIHGRGNKKNLDETVKHYLEAAGLWSEVKDRLNDPATGLSIGQQQRLCLARGLAVEPEVILCDEPTSALDPNATKKIEDLLVKLKKDYTIILVTHTLRQAKRIADYAGFIYFGEIIEEGPAEEVFVNPKNEITKEYIHGDIG